MGTEKVQKVLKNFGLTEKETELYIFLAKHGVLRAGAIAKGVRTQRVEVYRMLKSLQTKGVVEATLESPTRFITVPFETVLDSFIKAKREETALMESTKQSVLNDWEVISKIEPEPFLEKFVVVEGNNKIYSKLLQMMKETQSELSVVTTASGLARADQFGILDAAFNHPLKGKIKFRFLTDLSDENLSMMKNFFTRIPKTGIDFKAKNPNLGLKLSPRMAMRDKQEILFFIRPTAEIPATGQDDVCLWTNCKALVQSFTAVFEDLWTNSTDIDEKFAQIETGKPVPEARVIDDINIALKTYCQVVRAAKKEIVIMTSSDGLMESWKHIDLFRERSGKGVSIKILAPITKDNWQAMQELSDCCIVRHVPASHLEITVVDGKYLFQSGSPLPKKTLYPSNAYYTNDLEYVEKTKNMLDDVWANASAPSVPTLDSIINPSVVAPSSESEQPRKPKDSPYDKLILDLKEKRGALTEKDVLNKIINAKKYPGKNWPNNIVRYYGSSGHVVIHPPDSFNLPRDMMIWVMHHDKQSSFGIADILIVYLWLETPTGHAYVPVAYVTDNLGLAEFHKIVAKGTPSAKNVHLIKKDALQIRVHGNTLFAGWTIPIPLFPTSYTLPPSGILLEGYSKLFASISYFGYPTGVKITSEVNGYDAFVTFFHPASKYSGPGTDGRIHRDLVTTMYPPGVTSSRSE